MRNKSMRTAAGEASAAASSLCIRSPLPRGHMDAWTPPLSRTGQHNFTPNILTQWKQVKRGRCVTVSTNCNRWIMAEFADDVASKHIAFLFKSFFYFLFFCFLLLPFLQHFPQFSNCRCVSQTTTARKVTHPWSEKQQTLEKNYYFFPSNSLNQTDRCKHAETFVLPDCIHPFPKAAEHKISIN